MNMPANTGLGIATPVVKSHPPLLFLPVLSYSKYLEQLGKNGDGGSMMSATNFRKFTQTFTAGF